MDSSETEKIMNAFRSAISDEGLAKHGLALVPIGFAIVLRALIAEMRESATIATNEHPDDYADRLKALKLLEAVSEECEAGDRDGDHNWRTCRSCLARNELELRGARKLLRDLLATLPKE